MSNIALDLDGWTVNFMHQSIPDWLKGSYGRGNSLAIFAFYSLADTREVWL